MVQFTPLFHIAMTIGTLGRKIDCSKFHEQLYPGFKVYIYITSFWNLSPVVSTSWRQWQLLTCMVGGYTLVMVVHCNGKCLCRSAYV